MLSAAHQGTKSGHSTGVHGRLYRFAAPNPQGVLKAIAPGPEERGRALWLRTGSSSSDTFTEAYGQNPASPLWTTEKPWQSLEA